MSEEYADRIWTEIETIKTCMMVTHAGSDFRARPMVGTAERDNDRISFIANKKHTKDEEIVADPRVCLTYVDENRNTYVSISGEARVVKDRERLRALWNDSVDAWFDGGPDDPDAILIEVTPEGAEFWDNPNSDIIVALKTLTAAHTSGRPDMTEHAKVRL